MKPGAARSQYPVGWRQVDVRVDAEQSRFTYRLKRDKLKQVRRREGRYLLRTNLTGSDPAELWRYYLQLTQVEEAFRNLKGDLAIRPIYHQLESRIEAHIFIAFLAYCLHATLARLLRPHASGLTPRSVLEKFAAVQMIDVEIPTTGRSHSPTDSLHRATQRTGIIAGAAEPRTARPAVAENHRCPGRERYPCVVQTFQDRPH